jgi:energy-coupling factor transport system permease protein
VLAIATSLGAIALGGLIGPAILMVAVVLLPASLAGVLRPVLRAMVILTLPIAISVLVINVLFFPGGRDVLFRIGPLTATAEGLAFALEIIARLLAISGAISLFYRTTTPAELTTDLERRGVSPRLAFVTNASVQSVPAMLERAATITEAQRARGLDTEGSILARVRGIVPIVGPVILGAIGEVEQRTMALEARAFSRPGRRTLLWEPSDRPAERALRWLVLLALVLLLVSRVLGWPA